MEAGIADHVWSVERVAGMSPKVSPRTRLLLGNLAVIIGLICGYYVHGGSLKTVVGLGVFLLALANLSFYIGRKRSSTQL